LAWRQSGCENHSVPGPHVTLQHPARANCCSREWDVNHTENASVLQYRQTLPRFS